MYVTLCATQNFNVSPNVGNKKKKTGSPPEAACHRTLLLCSRDCGSRLQALETEHAGESLSNYCKVWGGDYILCTFLPVLPRSLSTLGTKGLPAPPPRPAINAPQDTPQDQKTTCPVRQSRVPQFLRPELSLFRLFHPFPSAFLNPPNRPTPCSLFPTSLNYSLAARPLGTPFS